MDFNQIRYFLALAQTLNFTRAAELVNISQPTLTQSIRRLEEELGGPLVHRDGRRTRLTELGTRLLSDFDVASQFPKRIKRHAREVLDAGRYHLKVGVAPCIPISQMAVFLRSIEETEIDTDFVLNTLPIEEIERQLLHHEIDLALIAPDPLPSANHVCYEFDHDPLVVVAHACAGLSTSEPLDLQRLQTMPWIARAHCTLEQQFRARLALLGVKCHVVATVDRDDACLELVQAGKGVAVMPNSLGQCRGLAIGRLPMPAPFLRSYVCFNFDTLEAPHLAPFVRIFQSQPID